MTNFMNPALAPTGKIEQQICCLRAKELVNMQQNFKTSSSPFCMAAINVWSLIRNNFKKSS